LRLTRRRTSTSWALSFIVSYVLLCTGCNSSLCALSLRHKLTMNIRLIFELMDPRVRSDELKVVEVVDTNWLQQERTYKWYPGTILTIIYVIGSYRSQTVEDFFFWQNKIVYKYFDWHFGKATHEGGFSHWKK
jgi:hypothetical protein